MDNKQRTILIADDAEINRDLLRMLFENDYNIIEASNGEEAIEALASNKDHIATLFLDLVMPKKNGLDVLAYMNDNSSKYTEFLDKKVDEATELYIELEQAKDKYGTQYKPQGDWQHYTFDFDNNAIVYEG